MMESAATLTTMNTIYRYNNNLGIVSTVNRNAASIVTSIHLRTVHVPVMNVYIYNNVIR